MTIDPVNPWLRIPEADYIGHMSSPAVGQRQVLNRLLGEVVRDTSPRSVLIVGCSTGNGLEHLDPAVTRKVTCVDINPTYLRSLTERFDRADIECEVTCQDLRAYAPVGSFDLIHAALVLEYLPWQRVLPQLAMALSAHGTLSVVVQLPSHSTPAVTPTPFASLLTLETLFRFVNPDELVAHATDIGLALRTRVTEPLPSAKAFEVVRFERR